MTLVGPLVEFKIEPVFIEIRDSLSCLLFALPMFFLHSGIADVKTELNFLDAPFRAKVLQIDL